MDEQPQRSIIDQAGAITLIVIVVLAIALSRLLPAQAYVPLAQPYAPPVATLSPASIDSHDDRRVCVVVVNCN
jgi:hypothetical protein